MQIRSDMLPICSVEKKKKQSDYDVQNGTLYCQLT